MEHPIAYALRTLTASERIYYQIEREPLSLVFGARNFHQHWYGNNFMLCTYWSQATDHNPWSKERGATSCT